jgi:hypothetical protein
MFANSNRLNLSRFTALVLSAGWAMAVSASSASAAEDPILDQYNADYAACQATVSSSTAVALKGKIGGKGKSTPLATSAKAGRKISSLPEAGANALAAACEAIPGSDMLDPNFGAPTGSKEGAPQLCGNKDCGTFKEPKCCGSLNRQIAHCTIKNPKLVPFLQCLACRESSCGEEHDKTGSIRGIFQIGPDILAACKAALGSNDLWKKAGCAAKADFRGDACCESQCAEYIITSQWGTPPYKGVCSWQVAAACMKQTGITPPLGEHCNQLDKGWRD